MIGRSTLFSMALMILAACGAPTAPRTFIVTPTFARASLRGQDHAKHHRKAGAEGDDKCSDEQEADDCVSTKQYYETTTHVEYSGCSYGPLGIPGSRLRTFSDTYLVTVSGTTTTRQLISSTLVSDVCSPM